MADNVAVTEGAGKSVATDDVGGQQYQRVKLDFGTDGVAAPALAGTGIMATGVQRVTLATDDPAVVDLAAIEVLLGTMDTDTGNMVTALQLLDNAVDGNYLNVNMNIAGTDCDGGSGAQGAQTQRVILATDDPAVAHLNNILTAVQLIDDAIYIDDANWTDDTSKHMLVGGVYQSTPHTVTDGDVSPLEVDANGSLRTVIASGTVTTVSTITSLTQMNGVAITMAEGVLDGGCQRVTLATDDDGVAHLATIATDTNNIETAIQIMDDWDATHAGAASADGVQVMGAAYSTALPTDVGADADAARICTDRHGRIVRGLMPQWFNAIYNSADASGEGEAIKAKTASRKIYILSLTISVDAEMWVELQDEDSNAITPKFWLKAGGGLTKTYPPEAPLVLNVVNKDLEVITEGAGNIGVEVTGYLAV